MIDHCISSFLQRQEDRLYRTYVTDSLKIMSENIAKYIGGSYMPERFAKVYEPREKRPEKDEKTEEEVINDIDARLKAIRGEK